MPKKLCHILYDCSSCDYMKITHSEHWTQSSGVYGITIMQCTHPKLKFPRAVNEVNSIPDFCPLEDYEGEKYYISL